MAQNNSDDIQNDDVVDQRSEESNAEGGFFDLFGGNATPLGSDDPLIKGTIASMFAVTGFGVMVALTNSAVRKK